MTYDDYQAAMLGYMRSHPYAIDSGFDYGQPLEYSSGSSQVADVNRNADAQFQDWLGTMSPEQQAEYQRLQSEHGDAATKKMRMAAAAAMGGIGLAGAAGAGMLGGLPSFSGSGAGMSLGAGGNVAGNAGLMAGTNAGNFGGLALGGELGGIGGGVAGSTAGGSGSWLSGIGSLLGGGGGAGGAAGGGLLSGSNLLNVGGNLLGGALSSNAANKAVDAQVNAGNNALGLSERIYNQDRNDRMPYMQAGTSALAGIQKLLSNPNSIQNDPGYQFGMDQGTKALNSGAAARGMTYSGQQGKALQKYGNDYAGTKLGESFNRLAAVAGIGQTANNVGTAAGQNYANNAGQTMQGIGNAQGSGYAATGNAWNQAIGNSLSGIQQTNMLDQLLRRGG